MKFNSIVDRRNRPIVYAVLLVLLYAIAWMGMSVAVATTLPDTQTKALSLAPPYDSAVSPPVLTQGDLVKAQWWIIAGLLGLVSILGQGFIIYVVSGIKGNVRKIFEFHEKVLTTANHDKLDHSQLCPICRSIDVEYKPHAHRG
jgi:hypothetical protein